jgi:hypothetical protein
MNIHDGVEEGRMTEKDRNYNGLGRSKEKLTLHYCILLQSVAQVE